MLPKTLLVTDRFRVEEVAQPTRDGSTRTRAVVRHPGAVTIIPMVGPNEVCLIRNYRVSVAQTLIELPAGTLEPPEPPEETARRELREETGFEAEEWRKLHAFYLSPGVLDERMHLYVATKLTQVGTAREAGEEIDNLLVPWKDALEMVFNGTIQDAKTIAGLLYFDRLRTQ